MHQAGPPQDLAPPEARPGFADKPANLAALLILLLGTLIYFHALDRAPLWNDEGFSYFVSRGGTDNLLRWIAADTHPPLYYAALMLWLKLGHSIFWLRSLSAGASVIALALTYGAARALLGARAGLLAMLLFATSPMVLYWAEKARPYAFQTMWVALSFWGFAQIAAQPATATPRAWAAYILGGGLAMLSQHPAGFFVLGCNCGAALIFWRTRNPRFARNWLAAQTVLSGIWLAWLPYFWDQLHQHLTAAQIAAKHGIFLISPARLGQFLLDLLAVAGLNRPQPAFLAINLALLAWGARSLTRKAEPATAALLTATLAPIAVCITAYFLIHPVFGYILTTFDWFLVPATITLAWCISRLPHAGLRIAAAATLLAGNILGVRNEYAYTPPATDQAANILATNALPGDGIVFSTYGSFNDALGYYLRDLPIPVGGLIPRHAGLGEIASPEAAQHYTRLWLVLPPDEPPAFELKGWKAEKNWQLDRISVQVLAK